MATMNVADFAGVSTAVEKPLAPGRATAAASRPVALSNEDAAFLDGIETALGLLGTQTTLAAVNTILGVSGDAASATTTIKAALRQIAATGIPITTLPATPAGTNNIGDVDVLTMPAITGTVTANVGTGLDKGAGAATATTLRATIDTGQLSPLTVNSVPVITGGNLYKNIAGGTSKICTSTEAALGTAGTSYLEHLVIIVEDPTNCVVQIQDGAGSAWKALPNNPAAGIGTYHTAYGILNINSGGFTVSAAAGAFVTATGRWP